ncbi:hypothetical protein QQ045_018606 [Rhodiola kirilowii]
MEYHNIIKLLAIIGRSELPWWYGAPPVLVGGPGSSPYLRLSNGEEFNAPALVSAMKKAWNIVDNLSFQELMQNRLLVKLRKLREGSTPAELASLVGKVVKDESQDRKKDLQRRTCDRFRVEVDVNSPIRAGVYLLEENNEYIWIEFKYERLPIVCFRCGRLSHDQKQCSVDVEDPSNTRRFGPHLRADYQ